MDANFIGALKKTRLNLEVNGIILAGCMFSVFYSCSFVFIGGFWLFFLDHIQLGDGGPRASVDLRERGEADVALLAEGKRL